MKKILPIMVVLSLMLPLIVPQQCRSNGYYYNWWVPGAAFFGGALFGAAIARPYPYYYSYPYYYPPAPAYAYPPYYA